MNPPMFRYVWVIFNWYLVGWEYKNSDCTAEENDTAMMSLFEMGAACMGESISGHTKLFGYNGKTV